ncbi:MAG: hypothetical protein N4A59_15575 [Marinifilum sp.]|jgi:hypothetical protein|nr:hypothetical protein [Marinifilum sp.]
MKKITFEFNEYSKGKIVKALEKYSPNEIGGILIGIKKEDNVFSITDVSISNELTRKIHCADIKYGCKVLS